MRVGVDYRILSVGRGLIRRGLGRFTQQQLRAVVEADQANEYVLVTHPGSDLALVDPVVRRAPNVSVRRLPMEMVPTVAESMPTRLARCEQFQQWVVDEGFDLFHATTPFFPTEPMLSSFDACPMVATFYDAIPLLFPSHYFLGPVDKSIYGYAVSLLRSATRLIAISDASGQDAAARIGIPRDKIDLAYPIVDPVFRPMAGRDVDQLLMRLSRRVRIPARFAFTVSYPHHSKNLENLLRAFARLPSMVRLRLPLVACCTVDEASSVVWKMARDLGIADDLVVTGPVTDDELAALYNRALFVVHPSRYEGFGLPVAEAMRCATPVITTTSSSLPEIAGGAAVLVDPDDVEGMSAAMLELSDDTARRHEMTSLGLAQSARFNAENLAAATLECYRRAVAGAPPSGRPRIAVWTPLPPTPAPMARPTAELIDELDGRVEVEVFVEDGAQPALSTLGRRPVHHHTAFDRRQAQEGFDAVLYHVDDAPSHVFVRDALGRHPGIAVVHAAGWGRARLDHVRSRGRLHEFTAELEALEGPQAVAELAARPDPGPDFWARHPMLGDVVAETLGQVVHDPSVADAVVWRYPSARLLHVPLGVADPADAAPLRTKTARAELGCDDGTFVVALIAPGATDAAAEACLRAVALATRDHADLPLVLVAGATHELSARLCELAGRLHLDARAQDQDAAIFASDVVVCVETGSSAAFVAAVRAMAASTPVLSADGRAGRLDTSPLAEQLRALRDDAALLARRAAEARAEYEEGHTLDRSTDAYLDAIAALTGRTAAPGHAARPGRRPDAWDEIVQVLAG